MKKKLVSGLLCAAVLSSVCVLGAAAADDTEVPLISPAPAYSLTINGKALQLGSDLAPAALYTENDCVMVPLRAVAEQLGYTVTWDAAARGAQLKNKDYALTACVGEASFVRTSAEENLPSATAPFACGAPAVLKGDRTYVPAKLFELLDNQVSVQNFAVTITTKTEGAQLPNPMVAYDSLQSAQQAVSFTVKVPASLRQSKTEAINVIDGDLLQVNYADGTLWRVSGAALAGQMSTGDISGDYNTYSSVRTLTAGTQLVTVKGSGDGTVLAVWSDADHCYSVAFPAAVTDAAVLALVTSVGPAA